MSLFQSQKTSTSSAIPPQPPVKKLSPKKNSQKNPKSMLWVFSRKSFDPASPGRPSTKSRFSFFNSRFSSVRDSRDWAAKPVPSVQLKDMDEQEMAAFMNKKANTRAFSTTVYAPEDRPKELDPDGDQEGLWRMKKEQELREEQEAEEARLERVRQRRLMVCPILRLFN